MPENTEQTILEKKYREAALALWALPEEGTHPEGMESDTAFHPWEPGIGRLWLAKKYAQIALRRKRTRLGDDALNDQERQALHQYANYESSGQKKGYEIQNVLESARYLALKALVEAFGGTVP